jgi:hypothetical protein
VFDGGWMDGGWMDGCMMDGFTQDVWMGEWVDGWMDS